MAVLSNSPPDHEDPLATVSPTKLASINAPKKRRRRTTAGGATDDCFSCRRHGGHCDRKRPYCSQCVDAGKECSGYKTTLTWGVGVASRGKLRGLACPVANKNVDGSDLSPSEVDARRRRSVNARSRLSTSGPTSSPAVSQPQTNLTTSTTNNVIPLTSPQPLHGDVYDCSPHSTSLYPSGLPFSTRSVPIPILQPSWHSHIPRDSTSPPQTTSPLEATSFDPFHANMMPHYGAASFEDPVTTMGSLIESDYHPTMDFPHTPDSLAYSEYLPGHMPGMLFDQVPYHRGSVDTFGTESISSVSSLPDHQLFSPAVHDNNSLDFFSSQNLQYHNLDAFIQQELENEYDDTATSSSTQLIDGRFSNTFFHVNPRLQSLMTYYETHVCPHLVTFDGPTNPYRQYILQLATQNTGLQNALAALATNNIRMRKKESARRAAIQDGYGGGADTSYLYDTDNATPEESMYKQLSIEHLNAQLVDTRAAQDDGVLGTLLILCLFHVCDSGFSKFRTQLAGMQKLLSMRDPSTQSDFTRWVQMFFTWFDVMTSTVNDRETQVKPESLDMLDYSTNLGALEQFSGCEGKLFKLISRLGRLNLLAQGRRVNDERSNGRSAGPPPFNFSPVKETLGMFYTPQPLSNTDFDNIDGNGWTKPLAQGIKHNVDASAHSEAREAFWADWHDVRSRLESWRMEHPASKPPPAPDAMSNMVEFEIAQGDLLHINECFRISALLYTERLANPSLTSAHEQFQNHVQKALYHITALPITSCVNKFLLWPLFMIGTECVSDGHRNIIRERCAELTRESGFFNNLSCLEVLEKAWAQGETADQLCNSWTASYGFDMGSSQPFQWRRAMDRIDGEYVIV